MGQRGDAIIKTIQFAGIYLSHHLISSQRERQGRGLKRVWKERKIYGLLIKSALCPKYIMVLSVVNDCLDKLLVINIFRGEKIYSSIFRANEVKTVGVV